MIRRLCAACTALACSLAVTSALAADLPMVVPLAVQPFYLVNQGPVISGPGIMIVAIGYTRTGLRQPYPFIGRSDDRARFLPASDYYGTMPIDPAARIWPPPHHVAGKRSRRKPLSVRN